MSPDDFALLRPHLEPVRLDVETVLQQPGRPIQHAYFVQDGLFSVIARNAGRRQIEVGHIGWEGMCGVSLAHGVDRSAHLVVVQVQAHALRMEAGDLQACMAASASLRDLLLRFSYAFLAQVAHTALANGTYAVKERLARWLLMCHDRVEGDDLPLTHERLALMLGVRRPGVTVALHLLEGTGAVRSARGVITVLDRDALEALAGGCYGAPEAEYERLLGTHAPVPAPSRAPAAI
jgi:CRP-like cAMP-binding protein